MDTQLDSFWVFALFSKYKTFSQNNTTILLLLFLLLLVYSATTLWYSTFPGGPAWGKYYLSRKFIAGPIPGPRGLPLIGSMSLMTSLAHHKLAATAERFNARRLMGFSLGETRVIVTCNPDVAREILNSSVFADRPVKESAYDLMFNRAIGFARYGSYWKTLRRIAATHLFCPKQITASESQRLDLAAQMVSMIEVKRAFCVRGLIKRASLFNMMCSVFGRKYELGESSNGEADELSRLVEEGYDLLGKLNWSDHLPWVAGFDFQRIRFRCSQLVPKVNRFVNRIIEEHKCQPSETSRDFVDVLLSLRGPEKLSEQDMIAVLWEMIFRGTDTVAVLIEWILARMVLHPDIQSKVHNELDQVVGRARPLMESDIQSLTYMQAVVKEVLRLHPPGPLLSWARLAITNTTVDGYHVPAGTTAMVNMWAITRDPEVWADPLKFSPERFVADPEFSLFGPDLRLSPFGSGRRSCPGKMLGWATVSFWVGTLLHEFEWKQSDQGPVDLSEVLRLSCEMASPLRVKAHPRRT
ncbi:cytochrome P450 78A9-like [Tripterygium wilfordii]|uniref:cytochrome P450 78A9-like n=1 Tax=Tripterygium wilfordii TaxID=458696 RepID=UPI0018F83A31|nr:cytochrome P450 78A9-like [Tripterygium wilfordii]